MRMRSVGEGLGGAGGEDEKSRRRVGRGWG